MLHFFISKYIYHFYYFCTLKKSYYGSVSTDERG